MIEIRITPNSPEMMAKVIALLADINGIVTMAEPAKPAKREAKKELPVETVEETPAEPAAEPAAELPEISFEQIRAKLAELSHAGKTDAVKDLFKSFGATKLSDIPEDKYSELMAAAENL